ncbi:UNVERIFIED_ORG: vacuolar-type H+-ATPase subunit I/STV1 [Variovorax guangxiensis]
MHPAARHLVFHGAIVLLFGLLLGAPYAKAIKREAAAHIVNSWRVAHLSLPIGATLMFATAAVLSSLSAPAWLLWIVSVALIVSAYGFCVSTPLAAVSGQRGLSSDGATGLGKLVYLGNMVGAVASIVGAVALLVAAFLSL